MSKALYGSHKEDERRKANAKRIAEISDFFLSIGDAEMDELEQINHIQARMLERGTGKLRKCVVCGDVHVSNRGDEIKFGTLMNKNGFKCFFCRSGEKRPMDNKTKRKREIMQKVWDLYIKRKNIGVKTYYLSDNTKKI